MVFVRAVFGSRGEAGRDVVFFPTGAKAVVSLANGSPEVPSNCRVVRSLFRMARFIRAYVTAALALAPLPGVVSSHPFFNFNRRSTS